MKIQPDQSPAVLQLLMIGPANSGLVGGGAVSFGQLVQRLQTRDDLELTILDSSPTGGLVGKVLWTVKATSKLLGMIPRADVVVLHASAGRAKHFGPVVAVLCRLFGKPWVFRSFGGIGDLAFQRMWPPTRWIFSRTVLRADAVLLQTKSLVEFFRQRGFENVQWLANSRPLPKVRPEMDGAVIGGAAKFIFVGRVTPDKGVREILAAAQSLGDAVQIDFFGPLGGGVRQSEFAAGNVRWHGVLPADELAQRLSSYVALLLPTYYEGEGYPGAILEAFAAGVPVIATRWRAIPEIVDETCGRLIQPRSPKELADALHALIESPELGRGLRHGAWERAQHFAADEWADRFVEIVRRVADERTMAR